VFSSADRLRRVLSDGALPEGAPPLARGPVRPTPSPEREARLAALRARLAALGVAAPRAPAKAEDAACHGAGAPDAPADHRPLEALVGGLVVAGRRGTFVRTERRYPLESLHGRVVLAEALAHPVPLRVKERGPGQARTLDLAHTVFLDTETTGLAGGTGTVAFLVGTGRVEGDAFVLRQYGLRDYHEEEALLHALAEDLGDLPLVTFNGRAFDWPLLVTRFSLHRLKAKERGHLDLLPQARRLWAGSLPSHSLATLERHVLGLEREDDLPGAEIPDAWFRYLRTGVAATVARAFRHNETDVVSMLALLARVGAILGGATASLTASPRDHLGTARLLLEHGDVARARRCLDAGLGFARGAEARPLLHARADLARRAGEHEAALELWRAARLADPSLDLAAHVEAAKLLEHRLARPAEALDLTESALPRVPAGAPEHAALLHRAARLRRRMA
jgi:uncharacterized protein